MDSCVIELDMSTDANRGFSKNQKLSGSELMSRLIWIYTVCTGISFGLQE